MNITIMMGRAVDVPTLKNVPVNGVNRKVANFRIAVPRRWKSADGKRNTDYYQVACWNGLADQAANYITKGKFLGLVGTITSNPSKGTNAQGEEQVYANITLNVDQLFFGPDSAAVYETRKANGNAPASSAPVEEPVHEEPAPSQPAAPMTFDPAMMQAMMQMYAQYAANPTCTTSAPVVSQPMTYEEELPPFEM